jgi:hypothetical protein
MTANRYKRTRTLGANQHNLSILVLVLDLARARMTSGGAAQDHHVRYS